MTLRQWVKQYENIDGVMTSEVWATVRDRFIRDCMAFKASSDYRQG